VITQGLDGIILAKTESGEDIATVDKLIQKEEQNKGIASNSISLMALLETPKGILNLKEIIAASARVTAIGFGAGDFSREMGAGMGVTKLPPEEYFPMILFARSSIAMVARASGIQAIDTPYFGLIIDLEGLRKESEKVKLLGFSGKQLTHPRHVTPVNEVFSPGKEEVDFAKRVVAAYEAARAKGLGATSLGGKMIDYGSFKRAEALLSFAQVIEERERSRVAE
jgi:citrate lyase subunit beta/citryl-CoA lyase